METDMQNLYEHSPVKLDWYDLLSTDLWTTMPNDSGLLLLFWHS